MCKRKPKYMWVEAGVAETMTSRQLWLFRELFLSVLGLASVCYCSSCILHCLLPSGPKLVESLQLSQKPFLCTKKTVVNVHQND